MNGKVTAISLALLHFTVLLIVVQPSTASFDRKKRHIRACGQNHVNAPGRLKSPGFPNTYPSETDCHWTISTTKGKIISIKFLKFDFENHDRCEYDYLDIYDGDSSNAKKIGRFCGNKIPQKFSSSGFKLFVVFHSDPAVEGSGFDMQYSTSYGCDKVLTEDSGEVLSPNYPEQHPQPTECNFNINVTIGKSITLTFEEFKLEEPAVGGGCEYDYVEVFDGPTALFPSLGKFCGGILPSVKPSSRNQLLIRFVADSTVIKTGFRIKYYAKGPSMKIICQRPSYTGDCRADIRRWFYNIETTKCESFSYGGCLSNGNNFRTIKECQRQCKGVTSAVFNECSAKNGGCDQACHNTIDSYFCSCWKGYTIGEDERTCEDVNECSLGQNIHHCEQNCTNMPGSYYCTCTQGFGLSANRRTCNDINECLYGGGGACEQECINTPGSFKCGCFKGFQPFSAGSSKRCKDINECDLKLSDCHKCFNLEGSYRCECNAGFRVIANKTSCLDINECLENNGGCSQLCINQPGNYTCKCKDGFYSKDPGSVNCDDIDECAGNGGKGNCDYKCENSIGSFNCSCQEGFKVAEDKLSCVDIDECEDNNGGCKQKCVNSPSSYKCECHDGFDEIGKNGSDVICRDIDECSVGSHQCDTDLGAFCVNEIGNYSCICPSGYYAEWNNCIDVNECGNMTTNNCHQQCNNSPGSFQCSCLEGYSLMDQNNQTCQDIDECATNLCHHNCENFVGSFICFCENGFYLAEDGRTCLDINECKFTNGFCDQICFNTNGSYGCDCRHGYRLLEGGKACHDIDECDKKTACCDSDCTNEEGGYSCSCHDGHFLSRDNCTCQDTNECSVNNGGCEHTCNNTKGSFSCSCRLGYEIDPTNASRCLDINECLQDNGGCSQMCDNGDGSYKCSCKPVYKLDPDGKTCDHCPSCETFEELIKVVEKLQLEVQLLQQWRANFVSKGPPSSDCRFKEKIYKNSEHWKDGTCRSCYCERGQIICFQDKKCFNSESNAEDPTVTKEPTDASSADNM